MLIACLLVACVGILGNFTLLWRLDRHARRANEKYNDLAGGISGFFSQKNPDTPSDFNQIVDQIAVLFADRYRIALTAVDRGQVGAGVRDVNRGLEEVAVQNNPALAIAQALPKSLKKNNLAQAGLMYFIQNLVAKQQGSPGSSPPGGSQGNNHQGEFSI